VKINIIKFSHRNNNNNNNNNNLRWLSSTSAGPVAGRSIDVGLRPLACQGCGYESRRGHGCLSVDCRVLSGRGLCVGPITRPEESYWLWCIIVYPRYWAGPSPVGAVALWGRRSGVMKYTFPNEVTATTKFSAVHVPAYGYEMLFLTSTKELGMIHVPWVQILLHVSWNCSLLFLTPGCHGARHTFKLFISFFFFMFAPCINNI
jgi:hypothetical protein